MADFQHIDDMIENNTRSRRRRKKKKGLYVLAGLLVLFFLFAFIGYQLAMPDGFFKQAGDDGLPAPEPRKNPDKMNILFLGIDQRKNEPARSDTIMVAAVNFKDKTVNILSIPRDTLVEVPGMENKRKINEAHAFGGPELAIKTIEEFLGIPINNYVETNFTGFKNIIDILGGVTIDVDKRMYYPAEEIDLKPGVQKLNGHDALAYVRFRHDKMGDITRIERQQKFLTALADQAVSFSTVLKLPELVSEINRNVKTNLSLKEMLAIANTFKNINAGSVHTFMVPGTPERINGGSYWVPDKDKLDQVIAEISYADIPPASDRS